MGWVDEGWGGDGVMRDYTADEKSRDVHAVVVCGRVGPVVG
jgi:hypothetical protein